MARPVKFDTDLLLDKAMQVFWQQGYETTSIQDLSQAMDLHPGSIYNTFGDKHRLFLAALDHYTGTKGQYLIELLHQFRSPKQAVERVMLHSAELLTTETGRMGCLMTNSAVELAESDPSVASKVSNYQQQFEEALDGVLRRAQQAGEIRTRSADETRDLARFLNGCLQGMRVLAKAGADTDRLTSMAHMALQSLN